MPQETPDGPEPERPLPRAPASDDTSLSSGSRDALPPAEGHVVTLPQEPQNRRRKRNLRPWIALLGLLMFLDGAWMLIPRGPTEADTLPSPDQELPTVVVDPGHGGQDTGAMANGLREKDMALDVAGRLERKLRAQGFPVVMTRRDDHYVDLVNRALVANKIPRALFVSIHFNDNETSSGEGVETYYAQEKVSFSDDGWSLASLFRRHPDAPPQDQGAGFARTVQMTMVSQLAAIDRGSKPRDLAVVRLTRCPAILVEGGFLNNPSDAKKIAKAEYRERLAEAIASGVGLYFRHLQADRLSEKMAQSGTRW